MFDRLGRGMRLARASWDLLMGDKELLLLPAMSGVAILTVVGGLAGAAGAAGAFEEDGHEALAWVAAFVIYFVATFIGTFFNAAIVAAAMQRFEGQDPSLASGLGAAWEKLDKLLLWSLLSAVVGVLLRAFEKKSDWLGQLAVRFIGAAWGVITFFVVPVLLFEPEGVKGALTRSAGLVKQRWGEQVGGNASISLALFVVALPFALVVAGLWAWNESVGIVVAVVLAAVFLVLGTTLSAIFNAALYRYATRGEAAAAFSSGDLMASFGARKR